MEVRSEHFTAGNYYMEFVQVFGFNDCSLCCNVSVMPFIISDKLTSSRVSVVIIQNSVKICPVLYGTFPVLQSGKWCNHQERSSASLDLIEMIEEGYSLNCFSESHFICQNNISALIPRNDEPVKALQLIVPEQFVVLKNRWSALSILWDCLLST